MWLIINNINSPSLLCFAHEGNGERSFPVLILTHRNFVIFPLSSYRREWQSSFGGHLVSRQHQPTNNSWFLLQIIVLYIIGGAQSNYTSQHGMLLWKKPEIQTADTNFHKFNTGMQRAFLSPSDRCIVISAHKLCHNTAGLALNVTVKTTLLVTSVSSDFPNDCCSKNITHSPEN